MTEQEMLEELDDIWTFGHEPTDRQREAVSMAMDALEELKQYREIGTVEEIKRMQRYSALAKKHDTIGRAIEACAGYEEIGTVEECREAVEKQKACVPKRKMMISPVGGWTAYCKCGTMVQSYEKYCSNCGQELDWSGEEETSVKEESGG